MLTAVPVSAASWIFGTCPPLERVIAGLSAELISVEVVGRSYDESDVTVLRRESALVSASKRRGCR